MTEKAAPAAETIVEISHFNSNPDRADFCTAKMTRCSRSGIGFVSSKSFSKNTPVYIRVKPGADLAAGGKPPEGLRSASLGRVTGSKPVRSENGIVYEIGVRYFF